MSGTLRLPMGLYFIKKIKNWGNKIASFLLKFLHIQLFVTLLYLPISLAWGLPFSYLSPIGNLIFAPFITVFLAISSIIFFLSLLNISTTFFCALLEKITNLWFNLLSLSSRDSLINFKKPHLFFLFLIILLTLAIIHNKKFISLKQKTTLLFILFSFTILFLKIYGLKISSSNNCQITYLDKELVIFKQENQNILLDGEVFNKIGCDKKICFNIAPEIIKKTGITNIDHLISQRPSITQFRSLTEICRKFNVKKLYMPFWTGKLSRSGWPAWQNLLETLIQYNTDLILVNQEPISIAFQGKHNVIIKPVNKIRKNGLVYNEIQVLQMRNNC